MNENSKVFYQATPNPQSMKFILTEKVTDQTLHINNPQEALRSPLAQKIFGFPWAQSVFIGPDFVTITKQNWVEWKMLCDPLCNLIQEHLNEKQPFLYEEKSLQNKQTSAQNISLNKNLKNKETHNNKLKEDKTHSLEEQIKQVLEREIRPAVAMDGGDVVFEKLENSILYLRLQGACSGCPSASVTLKMGIETRMKDLFPQVERVEAVE